MGEYDPVIPKAELEVGAYYKGRCRNATVARWNGKVFIHWRFKFTQFLEEICCPEDETIYDVFVAERKMLPDEVEQEIPLEV